MGVFSAPARIAEFREALAAGALAADGAMGTALAGKGAFSSRCLDELNLSLPALVRDVYHEYLRAGAQIIGTNTFGANRKRLAQFGFSEKTRAINQAGARIALEAARGSALYSAPAFVAGIIGPLGLPLEPLGLTTRDEARALFQEQAAALVGSGVDLLMLETFQDLNELQEAILAARQAAGEAMIVVAHVSVEEDGSLAGGAGVCEFTRCLDEWPVDVIGLNCCSGPSLILETVKKMAGFTAKPLSVMPNAGLPAMVDGRSVYPCSPEYLAGFVPEFLNAGARIVGGCCGTGPEHTRQIRAALGAAAETQREAARPVVVAGEPSPESRALQAIPVASRSELGARLASGRFVGIVEIPGPRGADLSKEIAAAIECKQASIDFVAIPGPGRAGASLSAAAACHTLQQGAGVECLLQFSGRASGVSARQSELLGAHLLGIRNVLCEADDIGFTAIASHLNQGLDPGGHPLGSQTSLLAGVALNPSAGDLEQELRRFEGSLKAGADYVVIQPVFDLDFLEEILKRIEPYQLPAIVGVRPLSGLSDARFLMEERRTPVPDVYLDRLRSAPNGKAEGVAIACEMIERVRSIAAGIRLSGCFRAGRLTVELARRIGSRA